MAINRKAGVALAGFVGALIGFGIAWAIWGMNKNGNGLAGKDCTLPDGTTKGKTDSAGVCKA